MGFGAQFPFSSNSGRSVLSQIIRATANIHQFIFPLSMIMENGFFCADRSACSVFCFSGFQNGLSFLRSKRLLKLTDGLSKLDLVPCVRTFPVTTVAFLYLFRIHLDSVSTIS